MDGLQSQPFLPLHSARDCCARDVNTVFWTVACDDRRNHVSTVQGFLVTASVPDVSNPPRTFAVTRSLLHDGVQQSRMAWPQPFWCLYPSAVLTCVVRDGPLYCAVDCAVSPPDTVSAPVAVADDVTVQLSNASESDCSVGTASACLSAAVCVRSQTQMVRLRLPIASVPHVTSTLLLVRLLSDATTIPAAGQTRLRTRHSGLNLEC